MTVTGDWARLSKLIRGLGDVRVLRAELGQRLEDGADKAYAQQFARGTSSTGSRWKPNKKGTTTLVGRTGALSSARARSTVGRGGALAQVSIRPTPRYAKFYGRDPRRILPTSEADLGTFGAAVERDVPSVFRQWLEGIL